MGLFSFFKKSQPADPIDFSDIGIDMHSHIIPGIDDGSPEMSTSIEMVRSLTELGYSRLITTPHVMSDYYRNSTDTIREGAEKLNKALSEEGIKTEVIPAAEYYLDHEFEERIKRKDILSFGNNYVLFELPFLSPPDPVDRIIFELQLAGYKPVLAHPERYGYWHRNPEKLEGFKEKGVLLQINLLSFMGYYGHDVKKAAEVLIEKELVTLLGTDAHHLEHIQSLRNIRHTGLNELLRSGKILNSQLNN